MKRKFFVTLTIRQVESAGMPNLKTFILTSQFYKELQILKNMATNEWSVILQYDLDNYCTPVWIPVSYTHLDVYKRQV